MLNNKNRDSTTDWKLCAFWLDDCECLPKEISYKLRKKTLEFNEFAEAIRDGTCLCSLLDYLRPNCIDLAKLQTTRANNPDAPLIKILCLENIQLYLKTCRGEPFHMSESQLFAPEMLYDLNLQPVIRSLSLLSNLQCVQAKCNGGFYLAPDELTDNTIYDSVYLNAQLQDTGNYSDMTPFILGLSSRSDLDTYQQVLKLSEHATSAKIFNDDGTLKIKADKYVHVLREIVTTEETFKLLIESLITDYLRPLYSVMTTDDRKSAHIEIFESLLNLHQTFHAKLFEACICKEGRTMRVCDVFNLFERQFMKEYMQYFLNIDEAIEKLTFLAKSKRQAHFQLKLDECKQKSQYKGFTLNDLLLHPFQRISKYHLLLKDLHKQREANSDADLCEKIKHTWNRAETVCAYLNEIKRDQEAMTRIRKIFTSLKLTPELNSGRLLKEENIRIKYSGGVVTRARTRTVYLFEKILLILSKNIFNGYEVRDRISIYEINTSKQSMMASTSNSSSGDFLTIKFLNDPNKYLEFYFKNSKHRETWCDILSFIKPVDLRKGNHVFVLSDFGLDIEQCTICKKYLNGIFFQGYKCEYCGCKMHKICMNECIKQCEVRIRTEFDPKTLKTPLNDKFPKLDDVVKSFGNQYLSSSTISSSLSQLPNQQPQSQQSRSSSTVATAQSVYCKALFKYKGFPRPPVQLTPTLTLDQDEIVQLLDFDDDEWWRGFKLTFNGPPSDITAYKEEGYFPRANVKIIDAKDDLDFYSWYLRDCDREMAIKILYRIMPYNSLRTIFLVRSRSNRESGGSAISFSFNNKIFHIKINENYFSDSELKQSESGGYFIVINNSNSSILPKPFEQHSSLKKQYFSIDKRHFLSIIDLVNFYKENSLQEYFHDYATNLGTAYREVIPRALYTAKAKADFMPSADGSTASNDQQIELKTGQKYFVINEDNPNWCYGFNVSGLMGYVPRNYLDPLFSSV